MTALPMRDLSSGIAHVFSIHLAMSMVFATGFRLCDTSYRTPSTHGRAPRMAQTPPLAHRSEPLLSTAVPGAYSGTIHR